MDLEVDPDESILSKALEVGLPVPHDYKLGVCMTCPVGEVDQSKRMLNDDVVELCSAHPCSDCCIKIIPEYELLTDFTW